MPDIVVNTTQQDMPKAASQPVQAQPLPTSAVSTSPKPPLPPLQVKPPVSTSPIQTAPPPSAPVKVVPAPVTLGSKGPRLFGLDPSAAGSAAKIDKATSDYVIVKDMPPGSAFNFQCICRECGWHTGVVARAQGVTAVKEHAVRHLFQAA